MIRRIPLLALCAPLFASLLAPAASLAMPDGFDVSVFAAHSNDRINAQIRGVDREETASGLALGLRLEMAPVSLENEGWQVRLYGAALLSKRTFLVDSLTGKIAEDEDVTKRLTDADAGEFYFGGRLMRFFGPVESAGKGGEWTAARYAAYVRLETGGISVSDSIGDLIDNRFFGAGLEFNRHPFTGTFIEAGFGKTDLFPRGQRTGRYKIRMGIEYTLTKNEDMKKEHTYPVSGVFVHVRVDGSAKNDAADGVRVTTGVRLNAWETLGKVGGLLGFDDNSAK